jgi:hypothetical protein
MTDLTLLVADLDFTVWGEDHDDRLWLHCSVSRWTPAVCRRLREIPRFLARHFSQDLWVCLPPPEQNPLLAKFLHKMGFEPGPLIQNGDQLLRTAVYRRQPSG